MNKRACHRQWDGILEPVLSDARSEVYKDFLGRILESGLIILTF